MVKRKVYQAQAQCYLEPIWLLHRESGLHNHYYMKKHVMQQQCKKMHCATDLTNDEANHFFNVEIKNLEETMVKLREEGVNRP